MKKRRRRKEEMNINSVEKWKIRNISIKTETYT